MCPQEAASDSLSQYELELLQPELEKAPLRKDNDETSFFKFFFRSNGPPQLVLMCVALALALGATVGVIPTVMTDRYARINHGFVGDNCSTYASSDRPSECRAGSQDAQDGVAFSSLISNGTTFATSALIGSLSDQHGRRVFIIAGLLLSLAAPAALVFIQWDKTLSPDLYYFARCCTGVISMPSIATASISDVMPPKWRAPSFGIIIGGFMLGFALAPSLALSMSHLGISVVSFLMLAVTTLYVMIFLPETLPEESRTDNAALQNNSALHLISRPARELMILNRSSIFRLIALLAFFSGMVGSADQSLLIYYAEDELRFNDNDVAALYGMMGVLGVFIQGFMLKVLNDWFGERNVIIISFAFGVVGNFLYGIATTKGILFWGMAIGSFVAMSFPAISAVKANNVDHSEQGRVQGALSAVSSLASALGPTSLRVVYSATKDSGMPGAMFLFASFLYVIATCFACALPKNVGDGIRASTESDEESTDCSYGSIQSSEGT